ncbi:MAG: hypothetical protein R2834_00090 [Rhodothermales bacterium]
MTRQQIIAAAEQIAQAVEQAGIAELLSSTSDLSLQDYLKSFKQYNILAEKFSDGALFLEKELGFAPLREPDPWIVMSKNGEIDADNPLKHIAGVIATLSAIGNMLTESTGGDDTPEGRETLSLVLFEQESRMGSSPRRISDALDSIAALYEACARIQHAAYDDLEVVSCDSGSDKLFVFEGNEAVIGPLKELILSIWERIVFYRERTLQERISLLTHSLPVLDKVAEMELHGSITSNDAEMTRKAIVSGVKRFLSSGSMMQKVSGRDAIDERSLIMPEPAAAVAAPPAPERPAPAAEPAPRPAPMPEPEPIDDPIIPSFSASADHIEDMHEPEPDLTWDGILEDDLKTLRELIDKTKRSEEEHG